MTQDEVEIIRKSLSKFPENSGHLYIANGKPCPAFAVLAHRLGISVSRLAEKLLPKGSAFQDMSLSYRAADIVYEVALFLIFDDGKSYIKALNDPNFCLQRLEERMKFGIVGETVKVL